MLSSKKFPDHRGYTIFEFSELKNIFENIQEENCPSRISFYAHDRQKYLIDIETLKVLIDILKSGKLQDRFTLDFHYHEEIADDEIIYFSKELESLEENALPRHFTLDLSYTNIGDKGAHALSELMKKGIFREDFHLNLSGNRGIEYPGMRSIVSAIPYGKDRFSLTFCWAKKFNTFSRYKYHLFKSGYYEDSVYNVLIEALNAKESRMWPRGFHLRMDEYLPMNDTLARAFKTGDVPKDFWYEENLCWHDERISYQSRKNIFQGLSSVHCPEGVRVNTVYPPNTYSIFTRSIYPRKKHFLVKFLEQGQYPQGLQLDIRGQAWYDDFMEPLIAALQKNAGTWGLKIQYLSRDYNLTRFLNAFFLNKTVSSLEIGCMDNALADKVISVLEVNNSLINVGHCPDDQRDEIKQYLDKNKSTVVYEYLKNEEKYPNDIANIITLYYEGKPRLMHEEAYDALKCNNFELFYKLVKRYDNLLSCKVNRFGGQLLGDLTNDYYSKLSKSEIEAPLRYFNQTHHSIKKRG